MLREHTAHLFAAGEDLHRLEDVVAGEEHPAQEAPQVDIVLFSSEILAAASRMQGEIAAVKIRRVVLGKVAAG